MPRGPEPAPGRPPPSTVRLPAGPWPTLLDALCARFPRVTRQTWAARLIAGRLEDERGTPLPVDAAHAAGRLVRYWRDVPDELRVPFDERVVHADEHLVVADKPHFLAVMPAGRYAADTLVARLERRLGVAGLVPLHRLDRGTAGLVLLSLEPASRARYQALFRERRIVKTYEAWAPPLPALALPLTRRSRIVPGEPFYRMREAEGVANSETLVRCTAREPAAWRYELVPLTGRKHQLRVHMAALAAPIFGDDLYPEPRRQADDYDRPLRLVARRLEFDDPLTGERRVFESRAPL